MKIYYLTLIFSAFALALKAQSTIKILPDTVDIDEIVITGTKTSVNRNQVPLTLSIINSKKLEESGETSVLPVLSQEIPGLFVTERGITGFGVANGAAGQISIRGLGGSPTTQVLVLLNGNPQYMGIMGHPLADAYRSSNIERIEVIRGPASTLYGSNAMGGVINIITKDQRSNGISTNANVSLGSFNTQKYAAGTGFKHNGFSIFGGINHDQTDGHREASFFDITDGYLKTSYELNKHLNASIDFSLAKFHGADPGLDTSDIIIHGDTLNILRGMGSLMINNKFDNSDGSIRIFYNFGRHDISSGFLSNDFNYGAIAYENFKLFKGNTLTFGMDYKTYGGKADLTKFPGGWNLADTIMSEIAGYATVQQIFFTNLILNAGFRVDKHSTFGTELVPTGGFSYYALENTVIKGSVSKGFRSPSIRELFIKFPGSAPAPNAELKPENAINSELTFQQKLLDKTIRTELTFFNIRAENLINVGMDNGTLTFVNTGKTKNSGIEFALNQKIKNWFIWSTNYTYIKMEKPITGTPKHKFYLAGTVIKGKFSTNVSLQYINSLVTEKTSETYTLVDASIGYQVHKTTNIYIKVNNLLNQKYQVNYGYTMPGINIMAGVKFRWAN